MHGASTRATAAGGASADAAGVSALALTGIWKRFGSTVALCDASLRVRRGTLHALLGENGAGKSTLMNVAFGLVQADAGSVLVDGAPRSIATPAQAIDAGLGMVHQHFMLVPAMTVAENVALGRRGRFDLAHVAAEIRRIGEETGMRVAPEARVAELGVAAQQRVEIVKALARNARTLILDEPTAVLAPSEAEELLAWVRRYVEAGNAAVLITHKLGEALASADEVTALRRGAVVLSAAARDVTAEALVAAMLGEGREGGQGSGRDEGRDGGEGRSDGPVEDMRGGDVRVLVGGGAGPPPRSQDRATPAAGHHPTPAGRIDLSPTPHPAVLRLADVSYRDPEGVVRLRDLSLEVRAGELLGVAGVEGAGQYELLRLLAGRLAPTSGRAELPESVGFVPEDRHRDALALDQPLYENVMLRDAGRRRGLLRATDAIERTARILRRHDVRADGPRSRTGALSGGNQQRLVLGRELDGEPAAIVAESPTRGLDVRAGAAVLDALRAARARGAAVVVYSADLDELLALADRVVVMHAGRLREVARVRERVGHALLGTAH